MLLKCNSRKMFDVLDALLIDLDWSEEKKKNKKNRGREREVFRSEGATARRGEVFI